MLEEKGSAAMAGYAPLVDLANAFANANVACSPDSEQMILENAIERFTDAHPERIDEFAPKKISAGEHLASEGDPPDFVYVLDQGSIEVTSDDGFKQSITGPAIVGELAAYLRERTKDMVATTDCSVRAIPSHEFFSLMREEEMDVVAQRVRGYAISDFRSGATTPATANDLAQARSFAEGLSPEANTIDRVLTVLEKRGLLDQLRVRELAPYETLIRQGDRSRDAAILLSGNLEVSVKLRDGGTAVLAHRQAGALVGESSYVNETGIRNAGVAAQDEPARVLSISPALMKIALSDPGVGFSLIELSSARHKFSGLDDTPPPSATVVPIAPLTPLTDVQNANSTPEIHRAVYDYNRSNDPDPSKSYDVVHSAEQGVVIYDAFGSLVFVPLQEHNAKQMMMLLRSVKNDGAEALRQECMLRDPSLSSVVAYTSGPVPEVKKGEEGYYAFFSNGGNWINSRVATHEQLLDGAELDARDLSKRIQVGLDAAQLDGPALILLKGNTAAGKTSTIRNSTGFLSTLNILDATGEPTGVINPDDFKTHLRETQRVTGENPLVSHTQVLGEGGTLGSDFLSRMMASTDPETGERLNLVIDKRFARAGETEASIDEALANGYKTVIVLDIDAKLETSLERVGRRDPNGVDPVVPEKDVTIGFQGSRENREALIRYMHDKNESHDGHFQYYLYSTDADESPEATRVATITPEGIDIPDRELFNSLLRTGKDSGYTIYSNASPRSSKSTDSPSVFAR